MPLFSTLPKTKHHDNDIQNVSTTNIQGQQTDNYNNDDNNKNNNNDNYDQQEILNDTSPPALQTEYKYTNLTGVWFIYFDNSDMTSTNAVSIYQNDNEDAFNDIIYDDANHVLYLIHETDTNELFGFISSPLKCYVFGNVENNGINVKITMVWSPNQNVAKQFAGYVTILYGEYDCHNGLNCEYCSFCFHNIYKSQYCYEQYLYKYDYTEYKKKIKKKKKNNKKSLIIIIHQLIFLINYIKLKMIHVI